MRFTDVSMGVDSGYLLLTLKLPFSDKEMISESITTIEQFKTSEDYDFSFRKAKKKRSMDANSYMWVLCDKIAKIVHTTKEEVYRKAIREVGVFDDVVVLEEAVASLVDTWGKNGIGYFSEIFDTRLTALNGKAMKKVRLYKGSHQYNQPELSRLIDYIVDEAKGLNIETLTDAKIKELENGIG